jgi:glycerol-1-phosphate dehydrogenase [NAD(P)+]
MKVHRMELPREVIVGEETLGLVGEVCERLGFSKSALVVAGPKTYHIVGEKVVNLLQKEKIKVSHFIVSSTTMWNVKAVEQKIKELAPQVVLGVGGGTTIDVAKLSSARQGLPFISVPTAASHDGIASCLASLKGLKKPYSIVAQSPMAIIADTGIILQAPHCFTASGCGDALAKFTAVRDWELAYKAKREYYGEYAASLALMSAKLVMENAASIKPENEEGIRILLEALISCGVAMSIAGNSRPCSGSEHLFSHALDLVAPKPAMHGEQCGVGTIMMAYLQGGDWKTVKNTLEKVGAPTTAEEMGIEPRYIIQALVEARTIRPERYTILEEKRLDHNSAKQVAEATGVIS